MAKKNKLIIPLIVLLLSFIFILFNLSKITHKNYQNTTTKMITTKNLSSDLISEEKIVIEGVEETASVKKYNSYLGYSFKYMIEYFKVVSSVNDSLYIYSLYDENNYIKIEVLDELKYYKEYKDTKDYDESGYHYEYTFLKNKDVYLKVAKVLKNDPELIEGYGMRMNYTINSIEI